ncbi:hypothetical protein ABZ348_24310 [Streptomyces sp. NPDC005963]|uniref:hypothetical protein n=1 Tax=Streptomyces sp. NPDC005963 TaxID=3156721 RepID=UPI00340D5F56
MNAAGIVLRTALAAELTLALALLTGVEMPWTPIGWGASLAAVVILAETALVRRAYRVNRRSGERRRTALVSAVRTLVPLVVRRLLAHEARSLWSLGTWVLRRRNGTVPGGCTAAYTGPQTALMWGLIGVSTVETVAFAVLLAPWPLLHTATLAIHVYGLVLMVALHAACVTRPHVVTPDGSLRLRYGALFDLRIPAEHIVRARVERRYPMGSLVQPRDDGSLDLIVGGQTTVTVELAAPLPFVRPLGKRGTAHTIRFHADDPQSLVSVWGAVRVEES